MMQQLLVKRLFPTARVPTRAHRSDGGLDLYAAESVVIPPGETRRVRTRLAMAIPDHLCGLFLPRSSSYFEGLDVCAVLDAGFRGEVLLQVRNTRPQPSLLRRLLARFRRQVAGGYEVRVGERVAQMVLVNAQSQVPVAEVDELPPGTRGMGSFGSSGR